MYTKRKSQFEFIAIMASLMSMVALAIDALLPALQPIGTTIGTQIKTDLQALTTSIFIGLGVGQLFFGPLSDSIGRKTTVYIGFIIFILASFICLSAKSLEVMLIGRVLQGIGLSAPRTISVAMVRDTFKGDYMAKIMSFIVTFFILIPVVAPSFGKIMLDNFGWQSIFTSQLLFGTLITLWLFLRQEETLKKENKKPFNISLFVDGAKEFFKYRQTVLYTLISGFITGSFMVYLSSSEQIFREQFNLSQEFPYIFAGLAITIGLATIANGKFVTRIGMVNMSKIFIYTFSFIPLIYIFLFYGKDNPNIYITLSFFALQLFSIGFLFGNVRSVAMQPVGHIAGVGAAINGFLSTIMAVVIATFIGNFIEETVLPLFFGFFVCGAISALLLFLQKKK